mmetsp:Transcript_17118/g.44575  ORF Transcript_17118/g.44575 Transcript_17118/m.44575 type:complete len:231 (+) Transcript_17118:1909-2601(+)
MAGCAGSKDSLSSMLSTASKTQVASAPTSVPWIPRALTADSRTLPAPSESGRNAAMSAGIATFSSVCRVSSVGADAHSPSTYAACTRAIEDPPLLKTPCIESTSSGSTSRGCSSAKASVARLAAALAIQLAPPPATTSTSSCRPSAESESAKAARTPATSLSSSALSPTTRGRFAALAVVESMRSAATARPTHSWLAKHGTRWCVAPRLSTSAAVVGAAAAAAAALSSAT